MDFLADDFLGAFVDKNKRMMKMDEVIKELEDRKTLVRKLLTQSWTQSEAAEILEDTRYQKGMVSE